MAFERTSRQTFFGLSALLFAASTAVTIVWGASMSTMKDMQMPGGWSMSMTWMPGQDWSGAALSFLGMWVVMMISMMMPSLMPMLLKYRQVIGTKSNRARGLALHSGRRGILLCLDSFRNSRLSAGCRIDNGRNAITGIVARCSHRHRYGRSFCGFTTIHRVEDAPTDLLPGGGGLQHDKIGQRRHGLAARDALWISLHPMLFRVNDYSSGHRGHGSPRDGCRGRCYHRRTSGTGRGARCKNHRSPGRRGRVVSHRPGSILSIASLES